MEKRITDLLDCIQDDTVKLNPEVVSVDRVKEITMKKIEDRTQHSTATKKVCKLSRFVAVAAIILIMLTGAAFATYNLWSPFFAEQFSLDQEQHDELLDLGVISYVGESTESDGILMTVEQVIGDEFGFYALIRLETDDANIYNQKTSPMFKIYQDGDTNNDITQRWEWTDWALNGDTATMYIGCWTRGGSNSPVTLTLTALMGASENNFNNVWTGNVSLTWTPSLNNNTAKTYYANTEDYGSTDLVIDHVCVTPVSVCVYYDAYTARKFMLSESDMLRPIGITLDDGTDFDLRMSGASATFISDRKGNELYYMVRISTKQIIDGNVDSIAVETGREILTYKLES